MVEGAVVCANQAREGAEDRGVGEGLGTRPGVGGGGAEGEAENIGRKLKWIRGGEGSSKTKRGGGGEGVPTGGVAHEDVAV